MNKKNKKKFTITSEQLFDAAKTKWNGFGVGHGVHGDTKYNRKKEKREMTRRMDMDWD